MNFTCRFSCPHLLSARIRGTYQHAWLVQHWGSDPGPLYARQAVCLQSHIPSHVNTETISQLVFACGYSGTQPVYYLIFHENTAVIIKNREAQVNTDTGLHPLSALSWRCLPDLTPRHTGLTNLSVFWGPLLPSVQLMPPLALSSSPPQLFLPLASLSVHWSMWFPPTPSTSLDFSTAQHAQPVTPRITGDLTLPNSWHPFAFINPTPSQGLSHPSLPQWTGLLPLSCFLLDAVF